MFRVPNVCVAFMFIYLEVIDLGVSNYMEPVGHLI